MDTPKPGMTAAVAILKQLNVPVSSRAPKTTPSQYVRVSRAGGGMPNMVTDRVRVLVECFADDEVAAEKLCNDARGFLFRSRAGVFGGCFIRGYKETDGPVYFPDENKERYQFVGELLVGTQ